MNSTDSTAAVQVDALDLNMSGQMSRTTPSHVFPPMSPFRYTDLPQEIKDIILEFAFGIADDLEAFVDRRDPEDTLASAQLIPVQYPVDHYDPEYTRERGLWVNPPPTFGQMFVSHDFLRDALPFFTRAMQLHVYFCGIPTFVEGHDIITSTLEETLPMVRKLSVDYNTFDMLGVPKALKRIAPAVTELEVCRNRDTYLYRVDDIADILHIGRYLDECSLSEKGEWTRALSKTEIKQLNTNEKPYVEKGLGRMMLEAGLYGVDEVFGGDDNAPKPGHVYASGCVRYRLVSPYMWALGLLPAGDGKIIVVSRLLYSHFDA